MCQFIYAVNTPKNTTSINYKVVKFKSVIKLQFAVRPLPIRLHCFPVLPLPTATSGSRFSASAYIN